MSKEDKHKRRRRQKQIGDLLDHFKKYNSPKPADIGRLIHNIMRKAKSMSPTLLEELITLQRPEELKELIGEDNFPSGELLPIEYLQDVPIKELVGFKTKVNAIFRDEDFEPLLYAIAYVLGGPKVADKVPTFNDPKTDTRTQPKKLSKK